MERLTGFLNGQWTLSPEAQREGYDNYSVYSRLAAYEDTGLTPGDVKDLQGLCKKTVLRNT
jgi:hypothetical protein